GTHERRLAEVPPAKGTYRAALERDPFAVPLDEKVQHCLRAEAALAHADVKVAQAFVSAQREHKVLVSSDGADVEHELVECGAGIDAIASANGMSQIRRYPSPPSGRSAQAG